MRVETERLEIRIRLEDKRLIEKAAAIMGVYVSAFVKLRLREAALEAIEQDRIIKLDAEESKRFAEALLDPPRKLPAALAEGWKFHREEVEER